MGAGGQHGRRHNRRISGQKAALQSPRGELEGSHGRRHNRRISRDKKLPSSPIMEPEGGHASRHNPQMSGKKGPPSSPPWGARERPGGVLSRRSRDLPRRAFATFAPSGTQIGARTQHRAVMSETQNRQETPHDALPARNKSARCSARNRSFLSPCAPIILQFGADLRHRRFWRENKIAPSPIIAGLEAILSLHTLRLFCCAERSFIPSLNGPSDDS